MKLYVVKKDGTREIFNVEKIINAVNKSAARILYKFSEDEIRFICNFAQERAESLGKENIDIQDMHNIVEGALDHVNPAVAKSYRDYRNYKKDFVHMMMTSILRASLSVTLVIRATLIQTVLW